MVVCFQTSKVCVLKLKLIISTSINQVFCGKPFKECPVNCSFIEAGIVTLNKVEVSQYLLDSVFKHLTDG